MFKIVLHDTGMLKSAFNSIVNIVEEVQIQLDHDGLRLNALDKAHITFVHLELEKTVFNEYSIDEPTSINLDTSEFMKVLGRCKNDDVLTLTADDGNLIIVFENNNSTRNFKIRLIDMEYDSPTPPEIPSTLTCTLPVSVLKDNLADIAVFSDKLTIQHEESDDYLYMSGEGGFGETRSKYLTEILTDGDADAVYSIDKVKDFLKSEKFSKEIILKLGKDIPLMMEFHLPSKDGCLSFLLAQRIEEE